MPINQQTGGWEVVFSERAGDKHVLTIMMMSVAPPINGVPSTFKSVKTDAFVFDQAPTDKEIKAALEAYGFNTSISGAGVPQDSGLVKIVTPGEPDVLEYSAQNQPKQFWDLYAMVPVKIEELPSSISLKGDWLYLYYIGREGNPPAQFFAQSFYLYSVRINFRTREVRRKGYHKGFVLDAAQAALLQGLDKIQNIIATGIYLDEPMVTVYYMKSSAPEDYVADPASVDVPYYGTTWENGVVVRTREYMTGLIE